MPKKKGELSIEERLEQSIVAKEEEPYKLPSNWVWTKLEDISYNYQIGLIKSVLEQGNNKEYKYLKMNNITNNGKLILDQLVYVDATLEEYKKFKLNKGDFLFNTRNSYELVGKNTVFNLDGDYLYNNNILKLNFYENISPNIISYYLNSPKGKEKLTEIKSGTTNVSAIYAKDLKKLSIPLPPLEEQKRIVEKLDSLFEKIQKIKEIIEEIKEKTTSRREAILSKAFSGELTEKWRGENHTENARELLVKINDEKIRVWEDECKKAEDEGRKKPAKPKLKTIDEMLVAEEEEPYKLPNNWVWTRLEDISHKITDGAHKTPTYVKEGIPFISVKDIRNNEIFFDDTKFITLEEHQELYKRCDPEKGDVLVTKSGTIGRTAIVKDDFEFSLFVSVALIKNIKNVIQSNFLSYAMQDFINKIDISRDIKGGVIKNYHISDMKKQLVPLPPLEEQKEIVRILDKVFEEENKISELISLEEKVEILEKTILDKAFRGELGTGNIDDEPAIELLKRVLEENE